jgi:orotate phosphoribosyltransferase
LQWRPDTAALVKVMTEGKSEAARVAAAIALLDRGWARPKQSDESEITHRYVVELPPVLNKMEWQKKYGTTSEPPQALVVRTGLDLAPLTSPDLRR